MDSNELLSARAVRLNHPMHPNILAHALGSTRFLTEQQRLQIREYDSSKTMTPNILVGVPEAGLVGTIAVSYIREQLDLPEIGYVDSTLLPPVVVVHDSTPKYPIRIFGKDNLVLLQSEIPLNAKLSHELAGETVKWARSKNSRLLLGVSSLPRQGELDRDTKTKPPVLAVSGDPKLLDVAKKSGAVEFEEGMLMGTYATLLRQSLDQHQSSLIIMAESYAEFPDPGAAAAAVEVLNSILNIHVDTGRLLKESEEVRLRLRELMARTQEQMQKPGAPKMYG